MIFHAEVILCWIKRYFITTSVTEKIFQITTFLIHSLHCDIQVLVQRSHALLHDEIVTAIYNMAAVDLTSFYEEFLRHFLQSASGVVDSHHVTVLLAVFHGEQASLIRLTYCFIFIRLSGIC